MDKTTKFELPYILAAQAQKHITHNEALRRLDALIHISIISSSIAIPPDSPHDGDCYLVAADGQGDWLGNEGNLACYQDGSWQFIPPRAGMLAWLESEGQLLAHDGVGFASVLEDIQAPSIDDLALLGINASADETNRLVLSSPASLFNHEGNGHQLKVNKAGSGDTASLLFQDGFSGRAEMGLAGNDDFSLKVSADGQNWNTAMQTVPGGALFAPVGLRLGANSPQNELKDYEHGDFTPAWNGSTASGDYAGMTGIALSFAKYVKIGKLVHVQMAFNPVGLTSATFTQKSTMGISGLPFAPTDTFSSGIDQGGVSGFVYQSIGGAIDSFLAGGVNTTANALYFFLFYTGYSEANRINRHFVTAHYFTDE